MRYGVIDIGSNSVRLMLSEDDKAIYKKISTTKIAEQLAFTGLLQKQAMLNSANAVYEFYNMAKADGADKVYVFATEAVRSASNGEVFVKYVKDKYDIDIDILSEKNEAKAGFYGAYTSGTCCTIDIGGASTEIAVGDSAKIIYTKSLPIGVVRLRDICGEDYNQLDAYTKGVITEYGEVPKADNVYAIGGTAGTIVAVLEEMEVYNPEIVHEYKLTKHGIMAVYNKIYDTPLEERHNIKGLTKNRADIICGGAVLLKNLMEKLDLNFVKVSEKDNLEGYLKIVAKKNKRIK